MDLADFTHVKFLEINLGACHGRLKLDIRREYQRIELDRDIAVNLHRDNSFGFRRDAYPLNVSLELTHSAKQFEWRRDHQ